ncbi:DUF2306 domain-containing protein [Schlesneria paludicola]|uniref:DUF2306 domain-containing protein n=1 Tax=Schlesneria paludicola TaxID=360056 RepID=UPI0002FF19D9|nr:DUF2306 domain-containing protein [Schlesneria paludicola]
MMRDVVHERRRMALQPARILNVLVGVLVLKVTCSVVLNYVDYFPANFESTFLQGRQPYFYGWYQWAFYTHILSGPVALVLGVLLINEPFRRRFPVWHRYLGRIHAFCTLFLVAPSGLGMAYHAMTGVIAATGFATLSILTGLTVAMGWRAAVQRRFQAHRRWMSRCFLLLCSAVVLRLIAGLSDVTDIGGEWMYPLTGWISWLIPLAIFESKGWWGRRLQATVRPSLFLQPKS